MKYTAKDFLKYKEKEQLSYTEDEVLQLMEDYASEFIVKSEKWDLLDTKIGKYYEDDDSDLPGSEYDDFDDGLLGIGEAAATAFGYL